jgi:hypothetical protein
MEPDDIRAWIEDLWRNNWTIRPGLVKFEGPMELAESSNLIAPLNIEA